MTARPPFLHLAIIGGSQVGKTTLFSILSGIPYEKALTAAGGPLSAAVRVVDPGLIDLHAKSYPDAKLTHPMIQLHDTRALTSEAEGRQRALAEIQTLDGFLVVLGGHDRPGGINDKRKALDEELDRIRSDLFTIDLEKVQRKIEKLQETVKKPVPDRESLKRELEVLEKLSEAISSGRTDVFGSLTPEGEKKLRGFQFFSRKPIVPIANIADSDLVEWGDRPPAAACLNLELELSGMPPSERGEFMEMYGLKALRTEGLLNDLVRRLDYVLYYTISEPEVSGWGVRKGTHAREAAGCIHTDMQEGFIAAEVLPFSAVKEHGSVRKAQVKVRPRVEGKDYVVEDGDILHIKFNR